MINKDFICIFFRVFDEYIELPINVIKFFVLVVYVIDWIVYLLDFIVNPLADSDDNKCIRCGPGLTSNDGQRCHSDCKVSLEDNRTVDLSHLNATTVSVRTQPVFSDSGFESYKLYNFSLCGNPDTGSGLATCYTNLSRIALSGESNQTDVSSRK